MRKPMTAAAGLATAAALGLPGMAQGHVSLHPNTLPAGSGPTLYVRVPNEEDKGNTVKVDMQVPPGFTDVPTGYMPGWKAQVLTRKLATPVKTDSGTVTEEVSEIIWTGGKIPPHQFLQFPILATVPDNATGQTLTFKTIQTYDNGTVVSWIGPAGADHPAPTVNVTAKGGAIQDIAGTEAGPPPPSSGGSGKSTSVNDDGEGQLVRQRQQGSRHRRTDPRDSRRAHRHHRAGHARPFAQRSRRWMTQSAGGSTDGPAGTRSSPTAAMTLTRMSQTPSPHRRVRRPCVVELAVAGRRQRARTGRASRPSDPELDVRLGGGDRPGHLLRGAGHAVAAAAAPARRSRGRCSASRRVVDWVCGAIGVGLFVLVVYSGFAGTSVATSNLAPTFIYVHFWVGVVILSVLLGDVFRAFNPGWRSPAWWPGSAAAVCARRFQYPAWLGRWPAAISILVFAWVELAYNDKDIPSTLATLALAYAVAQLVGMALFGIEAWSRNADGFGVYFSLLSRLSVLVRQGQVLCTRRFLSGRAGDARGARQRRPALCGHRLDHLRRLRQRAVEGRVPAP